MKEIFRLMFVSAIMLVTFTACDEEELLPGADRLFRPILKESTVSGTWMQIKWDRYKGALAYELEVSVDTFKTIIRSERTDSTQFTFMNMEFDTNYQIRLRSVGDSILTSGDTIRSAFNVFNISTLDYPTLLTSPASSDVLDKSIRVKWTLSSLNYTRVDVMIGKDSVYKSVPVTASENQDGVKIISGLQAGTTYIVKIFEGDDYKGKKTFKTAPAQVFEGDIVDLRDYTDEEALTMITQVLIDSLGTLYPNGFNMVLSGGTRYVIPTINLPVSVNFVTGLSFKGKAIMAVNGSFGFKAATTVSKAKFDKIFFTEGTLAGKFKTDANFGGTYLFNLNQAEGNVDTLMIESCDIKYKRGAVRMQTSATVSNLIINNCLFDSIGGYGIVNTANDNSYMGDILVKNSTILHAQTMFTCAKLKGINSFTLENVTTYSSPDLGRYFFDYNNNTVPGGFTIKNCLFGPGSGISAHGIRTASTTIVVSNTFKTSDMDWTKTADGTAYSYPIMDVETLTKSSVEIFASPVTGNFKVTDSQLVNKVGDPRWW